MSNWIIDNPVTWYSKKEDVLKWIEYLKTLEPVEDIQKALKDANAILDYIEQESKEEKNHE